MVHGSNDLGLEKMFPINIGIFDVNFNRIMTEFFEMNKLEGRDASTTEFMFANIDQLLMENDLSWDMVSAIGLDNINAIFGEHISIKSRAWKIQKLLYQVAIAIRLLMSLEMWLILALNIIVWIIFTGLISHPNGNQF